VEFNKKAKEYEKKKVTTDLEGNIILIKNVDVLQQNFNQPTLTYNVKNTVSDDNKNKNKFKKANNKEQVTVNHVIQPYSEDNHEQNINQQFQQKVLSETTQHNKNVIQPVGSNFDLFVPEVGVRIVEDCKQKSGGNNFASAFNKQSKYDYNSMLSKEKRVSKQQNDWKNEKSNENFNNNIQEPLSNRIQGDLPAIQGKSQTTDSIRVNNRLKTTLKNALDALDVMPEYEEEEEEAPVNNAVDIFKKRKTYLDQREKEKDVMYSSLDEMNKFNYNIIKNNQWGQQTYANKAGESVRVPVKPSKKDLEKELGKSVVNKKMPRSRISTNLMKK